MPFFTGLVAAVGAIGSFIGTLGAVGSFLLQTAVGVGLNFLAKAIAGQPEKPGFSVQGRLQSGGDVPRSFMLGYGATAGSLVYANAWGEIDKTPNALFTQVICVGDRPVDSLADVWVNGEKVTLLTNQPHVYGMGYPVAEYRTPDGQDHLWIKFHDGTQTSADNFLIEHVASADRPYESTRVGVGCPYVIATSLVNEELFTGFPNYKFALNGLKLYDVTKDTTAGGSGAHRWSTPSTWGGDGDRLPAVQIYNILRGMTANGQWFYGPQEMTAARLPASNWIAAINKCRAAITSGGATVATYRSGGEIVVSAPVADAVEAILTTCQGRLAETGGVYKLHVGAPGAASFAFSDGEILSTEEQSFTPFFGLADTINGIAAKYPSPAEGWNTKVAPPIYRTDLEALAGNRRLMADVSLDLVPYADQVQRLMKSALQEAQRARRHTLVLPPQYFGVEPGDILSWSSERNGYIAKLFRVDGVVDKANLDVIIDITEVDPSDYDWDDETDYRVPVDGPVGPLRPPPQQIIVWTVEPDVLRDNAGASRRPAIKFNWDSDVRDVKAVALEVRLAGAAGTPWRGRTDNVEAGAAIVGPFLPGTNYEARGRYIPTSNNRRTEWTDWLPVTTFDIRFSGSDIYDGILDLEKFALDVKEMHLWTGAGFRDLHDKIQSLATFATDQDLRNYDDKATLRREVTSTYKDAKSQWTEEILAATGPGSAIVSRIEELTIDIGANASAVDALTIRADTVDGQLTLQGASITQIQLELPGKASASAFDALYVQINGSGGVAERLSGVEFTMDGVTASSRVRTSAGYTPGVGYAVRFGWEGRISGAAVYRAAFYMDVSATSARAVFDVDSFIVTNGTVNLRPLVFTGNTLYADQLRVNFASIDNVQIGTAHIVNGAITSSKVGRLDVGRLAAA